MNRHNTTTAAIPTEAGSIRMIHLTHSIARTLLSTRRGDVRRGLAGLRLYLHRQAGRSLPQGEKDRYGCWYPSVMERRDCYTEDVAAPTPAHPATYFNAACTLEHCARMEHVDPALVRVLQRAGCSGSEVPTAITAVAKHYVERAAVEQARRAA